MTTQLLNISVTTLFHFEWRDQSLLALYVETAESDWQIKLYQLMIHHYQNVAGNHTSRTHTSTLISIICLSMLCHTMYLPSPPPPSSLSLQRVRLARLRDRSGFDTSLLK